MHTETLAMTLHLMTCPLQPSLCMMSGAALTSLGQWEAFVILPSALSNTRDFMTILKECMTSLEGAGQLR
jgi:hypothetical protein